MVKNLDEFWERTCQKKNLLWGKKKKKDVPSPPAPLDFVYNLKFKGYMAENQLKVMSVHRVNCTIQSACEKQP